MAITKMSLITINGNIKYLDETMIKCCDAGIFHAEKALALEEYSKSNKIFPLYSKHTGFLRRITNLAAKLGLNVSSKSFPELTQYEDADALDSHTVNEENKNEKEINKIIYNNPYKELLQTTMEISSRTHIDLKDVSYSDLNMDLDDMQIYISDLKKRITDLSQEKIETEKLISEYDLARRQLDKIILNNLNFDELFSCKYLKIRFGRLPNESQEKLVLYDDDSFLFFSFSVDANYRWCLYIVPYADAKRVDDIFSSLFFERIRIPDYAHGTPQSAQAYVAEQLKIAKEKNLKIDNSLLNISKQIETTLLKIYSKVKFFNNCFENKKYAAVVEDEFYIIGFIPREEEKGFLRRFKHLEEIDITIKDPEFDSRLTTPVKLKNNRFAEPFQDFVAMYGFPSYKDADPTTFFAISYVLLFGIMFGDMGQGFVIALFGYLLYKLKGSDFGRILIRMGCSSIFFGVLYGSFFGYEGMFNSTIEKIPQPYQHFINLIVHQDTNTLLACAVSIGILMIICSIIFNIIVGIKRKDLSAFLLGHNGIAGLIFYCCVLFAILGIQFLNINVLNPWFIISFIIVPLIVIFLKEPISDKLMHRKVVFHEGVGGFILENFFEMFEVLLGFITNTLSFLRVGAFVLGHVGMMSVVHALSEMAPRGINIIVIIMGNILVLGLEGMIVGIQVLRLEFYELFSRFFQGDGKPFKHI